MFFCGSFFLHFFKRQEISWLTSLSAGGPYTYIPNVDPVLSPQNSPASRNHNNKRCHHLVDFSFLSVPLRMSQAEGFLCLTHALETIAEGLPLQSWLFLASRAEWPQINTIRVPKGTHSPKCQSMRSAWCSMTYLYHDFGLLSPECFSHWVSLCVYSLPGKLHRFVERGLALVVSWILSLQTLLLGYHKLHTSNLSLSPKTQALCYVQR